MRPRPRDGDAIELDWVTACCLRLTRQRVLLSVANKYVCSTSNISTLCVAFLISSLDGFTFGRVWGGCGRGGVWDTAPHEGHSLVGCLWKGWDVGCCEKRIGVVRGVGGGWLTRLVRRTG